MNTLTATLVVICGLFAVTHGQDIAASALAIATASASKVTPTMCDAAVTGLAFDMVLTEVGSAEATVTGIGFYYTDNSDIGAAGITKSAAANAVTLAADIVIASGATGATGAQTVDLAIDATNCAMYTHICAVVTTTSDSVTTNDFSCIPIKAIAAGTLTVTGPTLADIKYTCAAATTVTFSLVIAEKSGTAGSLTGINLYFTDNAQYEAATVKSSAMAATVTGTPKVITATTGITVTGATAGLTLDSTNCAKYTHLCAVITVAADISGTADDDTCILLSATAAGVTDCTDTGCPADKSGGTTTSPGSSLIVLPLVISAIYGVITY